MILFTLFILARALCPANSEDSYLCRDETSCNPNTHFLADACCSSRGGKWKCPSSRSVMCSGINKGFGDDYSVGCGDDHCCVTSSSECTSISRSALEDCPVAIGSRTAICPYFHGPQDHTEDFDMPSFFPFFKGSPELKKFYATDFIIGTDGKPYPPNGWFFCPPHNELNKMLCKDGTDCDVVTAGWDCCGSKGGRVKCPASAPVMCRHTACFNDNCCSSHKDESICQPKMSNCPFIGRESEFRENSRRAVPIRQCSLNTPVMCSDMTCVNTTSSCTSGAATRCYIVPECDASEGFEATKVGQTAFAPCGLKSGKARVGVKSRKCVSSFTGEETATWGDVVEHCRPGCATYDEGTQVFLEVGKTVSQQRRCPNGPGLVAYTFSCSDSGLSVQNPCGLTCSDISYCSGHGKASGNCQCVCTAPWAGIHCEVNTDIAAEIPLTGGGVVNDSGEEVEEEEADNSLTFIFIACFVVFLYVAGFGGVALYQQWKKKQGNPAYSYSGGWSDWSGSQYIEGSPHSPKYEGSPQSPNNEPAGSNRRPQDTGPLRDDPYLDPGRTNRPRPQENRPQTHQGSGHQAQQYETRPHRQQGETRPHTQQYETEGRQKPLYETVGRQKPQKYDKSGKRQKSKYDTGRMQKPQYENGKWQNPQYGVPQSPESPLTPLTPQSTQSTPRLTRPDHTNRPWPRNFPPTNNRMSTDSQLQGGTHLRERRKEHQPPDGRRPAPQGPMLPKNALRPTSKSRPAMTASTPYTTMTRRLQQESVNI